MSDIATINKDDRVEAQNEKELLQELFRTSLDMEEQISSGVYKYYLLKSNWPAVLNDVDFIRIKAIITELIDGTERHKKVFESLKERLEKNGE